MGIKYTQLPSLAVPAAGDQIAILDVSENILKRASIDHAVNTDAYGKGTSTLYGHTKVIDDVGSATAADGESLSAHMGNVLAGDLGIVELSDTAAYPHSNGAYFIWKGQFVEATSAITVGNTISASNTTNRTVADILVALNTSKADLVNGHLPGTQLPSDFANYCATSVCGRTGAVTVSWSDIQSKPSTYPSAITSVCGRTGAVTISWSDIESKPSTYTPASHNQAASTITAGTLAGRVQANATAMATLANPQVRDIYAGTTDLTAGSSALANGVIYLVYE